MKKQIRIIILLFITGLGALPTVNAQTGNFGTGYFQNQYIFNPAMIGLKQQELNVNAVYKQESTAVNNGSKVMSLTADYAFSNAVGVGLNLSLDKIGSLSTTKMMATYGYQVQIDDNNQKLQFGLSAGGILERFNTSSITGDATDPFLYNYNQRPMQFEADFGVAYIRDRFTLQAAVPNLVTVIGDKERTVLTQATLFAAASYRFKLTGDGTEAINLEPKVAFRGYKGLKHVIDGGINADFMQNQLNIYGMYHSNKSVSAGVGFKAIDVLQISASYLSRSNDARGAGAIGNAFELGLRFFVSAKK